MKIVIAPDSWKESLSASEVAECIETGFREVFPSAGYIKLPMADGGEGTVAAMVSATDGHFNYASVTGPLNEPCQAFYGVSGNSHCAFIEMAAASGLTLVPIQKRNPLQTTSRGTGELILHALDQGVKQIIIGIGGSATNDGGMGMLQALGVRFLDAQGKMLGIGGGELCRLETMDVSGLDKRLKTCDISVACDVSNPLIGREGASVVFGPQKGATPEMVALLDRGLTHYAAIIARESGIDVSTIAGGGAAGGLGAALYAFCGARLQSGVDILIRALKLDEQISDADLVITGEGRIDEQTLWGKVPAGIYRIARRYNKPVIGIAGILARDADKICIQDMEAIFSVLSEVVTLEEALHNAAENLRRTSRNIAAALVIGQRLR